MAEKKDIRERAKALWIRGMKAVGNTAANIANNTRYKVDEVTIQNRRREVLNDLAHKAYALWLKGEKFPEPMTKMLEEMKTLDEQLNDMRAEKYAASGKVFKPANEDSDEETDSTQSSDDTETEDDDPGFIPDDESPVSNEINLLFDGSSSVGKTAEKVNQSLEQLSERIRSFSHTDGEEQNQQRQE